ncbi:MAG: peptide ABC transporter substrate-binding protein [Anaerolineae bacterium]|nr:peptide ABC transporter substrate-binding protein [Anaerolineae bacterium]
MLKNFYRTFALAMTVMLVMALLPIGFSRAANSGGSLAGLPGQAEPVTAYWLDSGEIATLDPQLATDSVSIDYIENLFLGLTNASPLVPGQVDPELATSWAVSDDGLVWTFTIRDDVPWVRWDPARHRGSVLRMVTAGDIEYGIKRACDPRVESEYGYVVAGTVAGCADALAIDPAQFTDADRDLVSVSAPDDTTLQVTLAFPASYFLSQTTMWVFRPVPREIVEQYGDEWTRLGALTINGPFVFDELSRTRRVLLRNPHIPADLLGPGNVERLIISSAEDAGSAFTQYELGLVDLTSVPTSEVQAILADPTYAEELHQVFSPSVFYLGFAFDKAPTDNVHVRRAFSAVVDRAAFIRDVQDDLGVPMIHFTPPGMFGAPPHDQIGVGYDPDYARAQMAEAGYPNCDGFPALKIAAFSGGVNWANFLINALQRELGCDPALFTVEQHGFESLINAVSYRQDAADRPHMWTMGWNPDYNDANNWVNDVLGCGSLHNDMKRPCSGVDDLIRAAASESDPDTRVTQYAEIEEQFFGADGLVPIIPLSMPVGYTLLQPWFSAPVETDGIYGGEHYDYYTVDQAAQSAGRGG